MSEEHNAVADAIAKAGSQLKLAEALGVKQQTVSGWLHDGFVPVARAREIEMLYGVPRLSLLSPKVKSAAGVGEGGEL